MDQPYRDRIASLRLQRRQLQREAAELTGQRSDLERRAARVRDDLALIERTWRSLDCAAPSPSWTRLR